MQADVDMSGRIEETNKPTVLALADGINICISISAKEKRSAIEVLKRRKLKRKRRLIPVRVFSTLLFLLLRDHIEKLDLVVVDLEYPGHEPDIKDWVMTLCRRDGIVVHRDQIVFEQVRKKSPAHELAYRTFKGRIRPDRKVTAEDVLRLIGK